MARFHLFHKLTVFILLLETESRNRFTNYYFGDKNYLIWAKILWLILKYAFLYYTTKNERTTKKKTLTIFRINLNGQESRLSKVQKLYSSNSLWSSFNNCPPSCLPVLKTYSEFLWKAQVPPLHILKANSLLPNCGRYSKVLTMIKIPKKQVAACLSLTNDGH